MEIEELTEIKHKATKGAFAVLLRSGFGYLINLAGTITLAWILTPTDFGIYGIINFIVISFTYFSDIGLGAAIIQEGKPISKEDLRIVFTIQQMLVIPLFIVIYFSAPYLAAFYHLTDNTVWMIRIMAFTPILFTLRTIPFICLEKELEFQKVGLIEIVEVSLFQGSAIVLALLGFGAWSFIYATILRWSGGVLLAYIIRPQKLAFSFNWARAKKLISFGGYYQGGMIISMITGSIVPVFIGFIAGPAAVGYINWASAIAQYPYLLIKVFDRVTFPTLSKLKGNMDNFRRVLEKIMRLNNLASFIFIALIVSLAPEITRLVYSAKWLPALPLIYYFSVAIVFQGSIVPIISSLNALGRSNVIFTFWILWMVLIWLLGYPLISIYGYIGYGIACALTQLTNFLLYWHANKLIRFRVLPNTWVPFLSAFMACFAITYIKSIFPVNDLVSLAWVSIAGLAVYVAANFIFWHKQLFIEFDFIKETFLNPGRTG